MHHNKIILFFLIPDPAYPPQGGPYPGAQASGYPPQQQGCPPAGYPTQQGYPPQQQPGYPPQQQPGYPPQQPGYPPQQQQPGYPGPGQAAYTSGGQSVVVQPSKVAVVQQQQQVFREFPVECECPNCHNRITTVVHRSSGTFAWLLCLIMFLFAYVLLLVKCSFGVFIYYLP